MCKNVENKKKKQTNKIKNDITSEEKQNSARHLIAARARVLIRAIRRKSNNNDAGTGKGGKGRARKSLRSHP